MQDDSIEIWAAISGYESYYAVSNLGRIRREAGGRGTQSGRILRPTPTPQGYSQVTLYDGGGRKTWRRRLVHQLVAAAFLPPKPAGMEPNHKNGIKSDNRADNLEWLTRAENMQHAVKLGLMPPVIDDALVEAIRNAKGSQMAIAARFGVSQGHVSRIRRGKRSGSSKLQRD